MDNSMQNEQKDHTIHVSAGDIEHTNSHCPSDMTKKVKDALLEEIKRFDPLLAQKDADTSAAGGTSVDAYNDWLEQHGGQEPPEANPDVVSEDDGLHYITSKKDEDETRLLTEFRQILSIRELQVWNLVMKHQMSIKDAADLLRVSKSSAQVYLRKAKAKFTKFMEASK
jgi:DNA-directed RNA polymerase specialized sigma subunit